ncbi:hypothetical protein CDAR_170761 [Caerostris darwini]|uniref:Uncharacterized protein n=1 Tax=Caerostris darwini TaxID=1538125 RepID=A0AAV4SI89_9ARAC|nr:hypothetical protein CDAR_170761 [Caerostris darwini]
MAVWYKCEVGFVELEEDVSLLSCVLFFLLVPKVLPRTEIQVRKFVATTNQLEHLVPKPRRFTAPLLGDNLKDDSTTPPQGHSSGTKRTFYCNFMFETAVRYGALPARSSITVR